MLSEREERGEKESKEASDFPLERLAQNDNEALAAARRRGENLFYIRHSHLAWP